MVDAVSRAVIKRETSVSVSLISFLVTSGVNGWKTCNGAMAINPDILCPFIVSIHKPPVRISDYVFHIERNTPSSAYNFSLYFNITGDN